MNVKIVRRGALALLENDSGSAYATLRDIFRNHSTNDNETYGIGMLFLSEALRRRGDKTAAAVRDFGLQFLPENQKSLLFDRRIWQGPEAEALNLPPTPTGDGEVAIPSAVMHLADLENVAPRSIRTWLDLIKVVGDDEAALAAKSGFKKDDVSWLLTFEPLPRIGGEIAVVFKGNDIYGKSLKRSCMYLETQLIPVLFRITSDAAGEFMDRRELSRAIGKKSDAYLRHWEERLGWDRPCRERTKPE